MKNLKWCYSLHELTWNNEDEFDTKEEAIEACKQDEDYEKDMTFWVGKKQPVDADYLLKNASLFDVENFNDDACEICTDSDGFIDSTPDNEKLAEQLRKIMAHFILDNFDTNVSWMIEDSEEIK